MTTTTTTPSLAERLAAAEAAAVEPRNRVSRLQNALTQAVSTGEYDRAAQLGRPPFLRGVSGRMAWLGGARITRGPEGQPVETGDDLDLLGLDYTHKPGVPVAAVDTFAWTDGGQRAETTDCVLIHESVENATVQASHRRGTCRRFRDGGCIRFE